MMRRLLSIFLTAVFGAACLGAFLASEARAAAGAYPFLYRSPRIMAMGGANVAIGGGFDSVFHNPAGLGTMKPDDWQMDFIGAEVTFTQDIREFTDDMTDAFDVGDRDGDGDEDDDQLNAVNEILQRYRGEFFHLSAQDMVSLSRKTGAVGYGLGALWGFKMDAIAHQGFGSRGLLEVDAFAQAGGIGALSYTFSDALHVGASTKVVNRESVIHDFTLRELVVNEDNLEDYFEENLRESGSAIGVDLGVIYEFFRESDLRPSVGLSVLNIGDLDFGDAGKVPMTVNLGIAIRPRFPIFESFSMGLDYVDLLTDYEEDDDKGKRLRFGGEAVVYDGKWATVGLGAGLYQGYPTAGLNLRLAVVELSYVTYAEEVGNYAGQQDDRRHMVNLNITW